jgi:hypothetical protein
MRKATEILRRLDRKELNSVQNQRLVLDELSKMGQDDAEALRLELAELILQGRIVEITQDEDEFILFLTE